MKTGLLVNVPVFEGGLDGLRDEFEISHILNEQERAGFFEIERRFDRGRSNQRNKGPRARRNGAFAES